MSLLQFKLIVTMLFSYGIGRQRIDNNDGCGGTMWGTWPDDRAQHGLHQKLLDVATGPVLASHCIAAAAAMVAKLGRKHKTLTKTILSFLTYGRPKPKPMRILYLKLDPLLSSLMRRALFKCQMPRLQLKSLRTFLCIIGCERTKCKKINKPSRSPYKKVAHMCATSGKAVNDSNHVLLFLIGIIFRVLN